MDHLKAFLQVAGIFVSIGIALYAKSQSKGAKIKAANAKALAEGAAARDRERLQTERKEASDREAASRTRLWMFAHQAVKLHRRWVVYVTQVHAITAPRSRRAESRQAGPSSGSRRPRSRST